MINLRPSGHSYRVTGAHSVTGENVELTVTAYDEADASRTANRQGVFVSGCVAVSADGTFGQVVADDAVVRRLLEKFPQLAPRLKRLNDDDQAYLSDLVGGLSGVTHRDSAHVARLIRDNRHLPRS